VVSCAVKDATEVIPQVPGVTSSTPDSSPETSTITTNGAPPTPLPLVTITSPENTNLAKVIPEPLLAKKNAQPNPEEIIKPIKLKENPLIQSPVLLKFKLS